MDENSHWRYSEPGCLTYRVAKFGAKFVVFEECVAATLRVERHAQSRPRRYQDAAAFTLCVNREATAGRAR